MKTTRYLALVTSALAATAILAAPAPAAAQAAAGGEKLVPVPFVLPQPVFEGTPQNLKVPNLEKPRYKARDPFLAPAGVRNVARRKTGHQQRHEPDSRRTRR